MSAAGLHRDCIDKFYTKKTTALLCIKKFEQVVKPSLRSTIIEPSAGSGAFFLPLSRKYSKTIGYDIFPECENVQTEDFLTVSVKREGVIHVVGNPPFGRQSSLAKKFIKKCCKFASSISFILPKSFKKESFQKAFDLSFHLELSIDLPEDSFELDGKDWDVPCVFQVWVKKDTPRKLTDEVTPTYWRFVKKEEGPDVSFRRVGVYAGRMEKEVESKSAQSHYFLRIDGDIDEFLTKYDREARFEFQNTVGPKSVSKKELNQQLIKIEL